MLHKDKEQFEGSFAPNNPNLKMRLFLFIFKNYRSLHVKRFVFIEFYNVFKSNNFD
jgi:hypothetical protein